MKNKLKKLALLILTFAFFTLFISCKENAEPTDCTITFFNLNGSDPEPLTVKSGYIIKEQDLPVLTYPGYQFAGWYVGEKKVEPGVYKVTKDVLFDAKWESFECTVTFHNYMGNALEPQKYISSDKHRFSPEELPDLKHDHYNFLGWYDDEGTLVRHGVYQVTKSVTLTAKWQGYLTLDYWTGSETYKFEPSTTSAHISNDNLPDPPERPGYIFKYWAKDEAGSQRYQEYFPEDGTLYAVWSKISTITFENTDLKPLEIRDDVYVQTPNEGNLSINYSLIIPKMEGKIFLGWYKDEDCKTIYNLDSTYINNDITLYAKWKDIDEDTIKISFVTNNGETIDDIYVLKKSHITDGNYLSYSNNNEKYYFYFKNTQNKLKNGDKNLTGWYLDENLTKPLDVYTNIEKDCTLYAKYGKSITLTCDFNDGSGETITVSTIEGAHTCLTFTLKHDNLTNSATSLPTKTSDGFALTGWYKEPECLTLCDETVIFTEDTTIYAQWSPIIKLSFVTNCDTTIEPVNVAGGVNIYFDELFKEWHYYDPADDGFRIIKQITKDSYKFDGWYTDPECLTLCNESIIFTEDTTVYAKWSQEI